MAKATELELLTSFKTSIGRALATGQGFETWRAGMVDELRRIGWAGPRTVTDPTGARSTAEVGFSNPCRLRTIFWSNVNSARSAGQWERAQRTRAARPYALYVRTASSDPRQDHLGWVGTILPIDHDWWKTHWPPNGWGCKCGVRMITARERERLLTTEPKPGGIRYTEEVPDDGPPRIFTNARTGEVSEVPVGIDPGRQTNPGLSRARTLVTRLNERLAEAGEADARGDRGDRGDRGLADAAGDGKPARDGLPAGRGSAGVTGRRTRRSGADRRGVQRDDAGEDGGSRAVTAETWSKVQEVVDTGTIVDEERPGAVRHRSVFADLDDGLWQLVVKAADQGRHFIVSTFHAAKQRDFDDAVRREEKGRMSPGTPLPRADMRRMADWADPQHMSAPAGLQSALNGSSRKSAVGGLAGQDGHPGPKSFEDGIEAPEAIPGAFRRRGWLLCCAIARDHHLIAPAKRFAAHRSR